MIGKSSKDSKDTNKEEIRNMVSSNYDIPKDKIIIKELLMKN